MDFTDPFPGVGQRRLSHADLMTAIRLDMAAELDAISLYQAHMEATEHPIARQMLQHIMDEEKRHLEEFAQILYMLDPYQADSVGHAQLELIEEGGTPADIGMEPPEAKAA